MKLWIENSFSKIRDQGRLGRERERERDFAGIPIHSENGVTKERVKEEDRAKGSEHKRKLEHRGKHMSQLGRQGSRKALGEAPLPPSSHAL